MRPICWLLTVVRPLLLVRAHETFSNPGHRPRPHRGGCGGSSSYSPTMSPSGSASSTSFTMQLSAMNETPPVTNAESSVTGTATISFHLTKDSSGNVTAATADFQLSATGFPAGSQLTMAHIHLGGAGTLGRFWSTPSRIGQCDDGWRISLVQPNGRERITGYRAGDDHQSRQLLLQRSHSAQSQRRRARQLDNGSGVLQHLTPTRIRKPF